jgi:septal ring factor EnvC (AmiA/AmiB activator)
MDRNPVIAGRLPPTPAAADNEAMRDRLQSRLGKLRGEFARGQEQLIETEARARELREKLLRIAGAIQVLEEELDAPPGPG